MAMRCYSSTRMAIWFLVLLGFSVVIVRVHGQFPDTTGFISIDCGIAPGSSYSDAITHIPYTSDAQYISTGVNHKIQMQYATNSTPRQHLTLRSFPNGTRNCYTLNPAVQGQKYLLRAYSFYGNYDGRNSARADNPILFDLYLGVNLWTTLNITDDSSPYRSEAIAVASADFFSVCLINTGSGTPFINSLELRALKNYLYPPVNSSVTLSFFRRFTIGPMSDNILRYPDDPYDRIWQAGNNPPYWTEVNTSRIVQNPPSSACEVPTAVLQTASVPNMAYDLYKLQLFWTAVSGSTALGHYVFMHFAEIQSLSSTDIRAFNIYLNDNLWIPEPYSPLYLLGTSIYSTAPEYQYQFNFSLTSTDNSTLPPILNGLEIYTMLQILNQATDNGDVYAMMDIKGRYQVKRNWMGDPCAPIAFAWDGLNCTYGISNPPRVTTLNLSSSGLTGNITTSFADLKAIQYLDLSYNNLTGTIPNILEGLSSLKLLDLTSNQLSGLIPAGLLSRSQNGTLTLRYGGNLNLCIDESTCGKKKTSATHIPVALLIIPVVILVILLLIVFILCRCRRRKGTYMRPQKEGRPSQDYQDNSLQFENRQFTYTDLKDITNKFERVIGKGGFGTVYHGYLEDGTEVAVKMRSESSKGNNDFLIEAQHLTRIHHRNLVSFLGYCKDTDHQALVFEYMARGSLQEQLRGEASNTRPLTWGERLRIALEAAQGLEYLHKGCKPPLIHRDVKTANILLNEKLEAKIADFGLTKAFNADAQTHVSTAVAGTLGYLDPEYYSTFRLSEKSDVYSFGVVLLELITGKPPILQGPENGHIIQWVHQKLSGGNIDVIIDAKMQGLFDVNSVWKAVDVATKCMEQASIKRPTLSDVLMQLKESLELDVANRTGQNLQTDSVNSYQNCQLEAAHSGNTSVYGGPSVR